MAELCNNNNLKVNDICRCTDCTKFILSTSIDLKVMCIVKITKIDNSNGSPYPVEIEDLKNRFCFLNNFSNLKKLTIEELLWL
jgi:hypothetical protein